MNVDQRTSCPRLMVGVPQNKLKWNDRKQNIPKCGLQKCRMRYCTCMWHHLSMKIHVMPVGHTKILLCTLLLRTLHYMYCTYMVHTMYVYVMDIQCTVYMYMQYLSVCVGLQIGLSSESLCYVRSWTWVPLSTQE